MGALDHLLGVHDHVVPQIVEPELAVRPVGDVRPVGLVALLRRHVGVDNTDGEPKKVVDRGHPGGVALGQVVVDRNQVDALPGKRVQDHGQRGHEGLPLAGPHLGDAPVVQGHASDQLHVVVPEPYRPPGHLAHEREDLDEKFLQGLPVPGPIAQAGAHGAQLLLAPGLQVLRELVDLLHNALVLSQRTVVGVQPQRPLKRVPYHFRSFTSDDAPSAGGVLIVCQVCVSNL